MPMKLLAGCVEELMKCVEVNDAYSIYVLGSHYYNQTG